MQLQPVEGVTSRMGQLAQGQVLAKEAPALVSILALQPTHQRARLEAVLWCTKLFVLALYSWSKIVKNTKIYN